MAGEKLPLQFRYVVEADTKVNAFVPKELAEGTDKMSLRASQFGAAMPVSSIPNSDVVGLVWEAGFAVIGTHLQDSCR